MTDGNYKQPVLGAFEQHGNDDWESAPPVPSLPTGGGPGVVRTKGLSPRKLLGKSTRKPPRSSPRQRRATSTLVANNLTARIALAIPASMYTVVDDIARYEGRTRSAVFRTLIQMGAWTYERLAHQLGVPGSSPSPSPLWLLMDEKIAQTLTASLKENPPNGYE